MDTDLEQLIKGGPFELSLAADRLGNNLFGINAGAQVGLNAASPPHPPVTPSLHDNKFAHASERSSVSPGSCHLI